MPKIVGVLKHRSLRGSFDNRKPPLMSNVKAIETVPRLKTGYHSAYGALGDLRKGRTASILTRSSMESVLVKIRSQFCLLAQCYAARASFGRHVVSRNR